MSVLEWQEVARDELADIYVAATPDERERIVAEVERIERDLKDDPLEVGEGRAGDIRVEIRGLLVFWFEVLRGGGLVRMPSVTRPR
jgi:hypothetical protein